VQQPKKHATPIPARFRPPRPTSLKREAVAAAPGAIAVGAATTSGSSALVPLIFGTAIGLALLGIAVALMPAWAVPGSVSRVVEGHREDIVIGGVAAVLSILVSLMIALGGS
jgi:hypothetical protein